MHYRLVATLHIESWLNDFYSEDNASICNCASTPRYNCVIHIITTLNLYCAYYVENKIALHSKKFNSMYKDWLVDSLFNQVGSICAIIMFSVSFLIA